MKEGKKQEEEKRGRGKEEGRKEKNLNKGRNKLVKEE